MFQFSYKLKVAERVKAKCERHPRYNPERDGRGGIKGGCSNCFSLFDCIRRGYRWTPLTATQQNKRTGAEKSSVWKPTSLIRGVALAAPSLRRKSAQWCQKVLLSARLDVRCRDSPTQRRAAGPFRGRYETQFWRWWKAANALADDVLALARTSFSSIHLLNVDFS
jgi:hypothetical protein